MEHMCPYNPKTEKKDIKKGFILVSSWCEWLLKEILSNVPIKSILRVMLKLVLARNYWNCTNTYFNDSIYICLCNGICVFTGKMWEGQKTACQQHL